MGVGPHGGWRLRLFGAQVAQAFGHAAYQVGSSLTEKRDFRDVDVRLILPDDEYATFFGEWDLADPVRRMWERAWSAYGRDVTGGLPIDFQIQQQTAANAEFDGPRSALLVMDYELPVARSA